MTNIEAKGIIYRIFDTVHKGAFASRKFVLLIPHDKYPKHIIFECVQDKTSLLDSVSEEDNVIVKFSVDGRKWQAPGKDETYFNSLKCFAIKLADGEKVVENKKSQSNVTHDDLPF